MPNIKAAFRAMRKSKKNAQQNQNVLENIQYLLKQSRKFMDQKEAVKAEEGVKKTIVALDKACQKGIIKTNTAARKKSRLLQKFHAIQKVK